MNTKRNKTKTLLVVGLLLAVSGLTLGFAAFSNTLTIKSSATVTPDASTFSVQFSASETEILVGEENPIIPELFDSTSQDLVTASNAIIDGDNPTTISNLNVSMIHPGEKATYYFYIHNTGEYDAYLNEMIFHNVEGENSNIVCKAIETGDETRATDELVEATCEKIVVTVSVSNDNWDSNATLKSNNSSLLMSNKLLEKNTSTNIMVRIATPTAAYFPDGPFEVIIGDIELVWSTMDVNAG